MISVVIPAKNEESNIAEVIRKCRPHADEIIVVDGHSTDRTVQIARESGALVLFDNGKGKGAAIQVGLRQAGGEVIVFVDSDGSHDPDDIPRLIRPIQEGYADLVVGSRMRGGSDELHGDLEKFIRVIGSDIITLCINYRFGVRLTDSQNGFRAIRKDVGISINLQEDIFTIEQEMIMKALRKGYSVVEIPAHEYERRSGKSHIVVWKVAHRYVWCLLKNLF
jgi:dolichol-phosphate mannosyltransferase